MDMIVSSCQNQTLNAKLYLENYGLRLLLTPTKKKTKEERPQKRPKNHSLPPLPPPATKTKPFSILYSLYSLCPFSLFTQIQSNGCLLILGKPR
ncbi:hypothetical protein Peur_049471 [Populus x canadensis]